MKTIYERIFSLLLLSLCWIVVGVFLPYSSSAESKVPGAKKELKVALVNFLSGAPAKAGTAAINAGRLVIDDINKKGGIAGVKIQPIVVDEAGGAERQVTEFRRLVLDEKVDVVIGYLSSSDCLAIAPLSDELETLTILGGCGTSRLFEEENYKYLFRAVNYEGSENVAAALYVLSKKPNLKTIVGINQDYSWGRDSWETFKRAMLKLKPDVQIVDVLWPKFGTVDFGAEISKILADKPDIVHTSLWGGFLDSFITQAAPRGLFKQSLVVSTVGERSLITLGKNMPEGVIIGGRGGYIPYSLPDPKLNSEAKRFYKEYEARYREVPMADSFYMVQDIMAMKAAYEKAIKIHSRWPAKQEVSDALKFLSFDSLGIHVSMALANGHQAIHPQVFAITGSKHDPKWQFPLPADVRIYPADKVNPPQGVKHLDWIQSWQTGR